ncbi:CACTA en-spm transposon protein [Cucumis melo var. makuwa]|uniref:CACTA en-spm transposon protein n=1 Tax=Cucumis melo var. makuwa TaxID=1194695 RepID=A0A5D3DXP1_CUCMM|nr:CACTA en-spm transposon protein [Cucumis melo var. makuwa]
MGNTSDASQPTARTLRRQEHSKNLELDRYVALNGKIPISIALGQYKSISPHVVRFSNTTGETQDTFSIYFLKWTNVTLEYIELVKSALQQWFVLNFIDPTLAQFLEHQMLTYWKDFRGQNHYHFKKFSDHEQAHANPPPKLRMATRAKQPYHHNSNAELFLQRQDELAKQWGHLIDHVELFKETHAQGGQFVSVTVVDAHNLMLELQSQPTPQNSQPLSWDEICETVLGRRSGYSKGVGWDPKPKS